MVTLSLYPSETSIRDKTVRFDALRGACLQAKTHNPAVDRLLYTHTRMSLILYTPLAASALTVSSLLDGCIGCTM